MHRFMLWLSVITFSSVANSQSFKYNICALEHHKERCAQLERNGFIKCILLLNEAACLDRINSGELHFGAVSAEAAFLAAPFTSEVNVLASILENGAKYKYETVVLTNKPVESFADLKGFTYCHPGLDGTDVTPYLLQELEWKILEVENKMTTLCEGETTTISENYIKTLNNFFGPSCRQGRWVQDIDLDVHLKSKYKNLTSLCATSANTGSPLENSLACLRNVDPKVRGAVAVTTMFTQQHSTDGLSYLCKNGKTGEKCFWAQQPYRLLITTNSIELNMELGDNLPAWFPDTYKPSVRTEQSGATATVKLTEDDRMNLATILGLKRPADEITDINIPLSNYTAARREVPTRAKAKLCKTDMRWCTISAEEQEKCEWLSQASLNYGIQPVVECKQVSNKIECLEAIRDDKADLVVIEADDGFTAQKKNLSAIAFPETIAAYELKTMLVVKDNSITRLENLMGKKGCFSRYGDIAWLSFIHVMRGVIADKGSCDYGKIISDMVGDSCMPMVVENSRAISDTVDKQKVCGLCVNSCDALKTNEFYGEQGSLKCLAEMGEFAVFTRKAQDISFPNNTRILCKNGTLAAVGQTDVDDSCYLSVLTTSEIVTRRGDKKNKDVQLALQEFDKRFTVGHETPFLLFNSFHETADLLFMDSTPGLALPTSSKQLIKSYVEVFKKVDDCSAVDVTSTVAPIEISTNASVGNTTSTVKPGTNGSNILKIYSSLTALWIAMLLYK